MKNNLHMHLTTHYLDIPTRNSNYTKELYTFDTNLVPTSHEKDESRNQEAKRENYKTHTENVLDMAMKIGCKSLNYKKGNVRRLFTYSQPHALLIFFSCLLGTISMECKQAHVSLDKVTLL